MSSKAVNPIMRSAAWRISLWASLAFAIGTMLVFAMLHRFVADDIQRRSDAWLSGEVGVLGDVAARTPKDRLYRRVVGEVAELASREVPNRQRSSGNENDAVFFLQAGDSGPAKLWVGSGDGVANLAAIRSTRVLPDVPFDIRIQGSNIPFRVASVRIEDGSSIYLGLSERDELHVLRNLRVRFLTLCAAIVLLGFVIVFYATRKMLGRVSEITEAASRIGQSDLSSRVPDTKGDDEIGHLARTLNHMLDRIESTVHQLHTITDSLAHDLRSPLTAIRGKLETALASDVRDHAESIVSAIDELDRLTEFLNTSLDVAEAKADALRLSRTEVDLDALVRGMIDLYEPSMSEKGLGVQIRARAQSKCSPTRRSSTASSPTYSITNSNIYPLHAWSVSRFEQMITRPRLPWKITALASMLRLVVTSSSEESKDAHLAAMDLDLLSLRRLSVFMEAGWQRQIVMKAERNSQSRSPCARLRSERSLTPSRC